MTNESAAQRSQGILEETLDELRGLLQVMARVHVAEVIGIGISMPQAKTLYLAASSGPLHMSELAGRLGVTLSTVSGLVDRLVEAGLAERHEDPADRRQTFVGATARGVELVERFQELNVAHLRRLLEQLDDADLAAVRRAFRILARIAVTAGPSQQPGASQQQEQPAP
ncbi:MAG TPA: MarR family transcriptional regulator [Candidatus Limnocylindrales bacterium]